MKPLSERIDEVLADIKYGQHSQMRFKPFQGTILAATYAKEIAQAKSALLQTFSDCMEEVIDTKSDIFMPSWFPKNVEQLKEFSRDSSEWLRHEQHQRLANLLGKDV